MRIVKAPAEMRELAEAWRRAGEAIGLVPTMGVLHQGHLALLRRCRAENGVSVMSLFVNPTQFGRGEDYATYPRDSAGDLAKAQGAGVDAIYAPEAGDMYPDGYATYVEVERLTEGMCGAFRPSHFRGVATVVAKLFNAVRPHRAYFGQKDYQQSVVIGRMVADLDMGIEIIVLPTVRDPDGLALSSRNANLSPEERRAALSLSRSLRWAEEQVRKGERDANTLAKGIEGIIGREPLVTLQYAVIADADTLAAIPRIEGPAVIALAAKVGRTRLIDNTLISP